MLGLGVADKRGVLLSIILGPIRKFLLAVSVAHAADKFRRLTLGTAVTQRLRRGQPDARLPAVPRLLPWLVWPLRRAWNGLRLASRVSPPAVFHCREVRRKPCRHRRPCASRRGRCAGIHPRGLRNGERRYQRVCPRRHSSSGKQAPGGVPPDPRA